ncbi:unnamed protein product, partial [Thlaspi arvense]
EERTWKGGYEAHDDRGYTPAWLTNKLSWREFKRIRKSHFGKADLVNPVGELSNLRHTGTINDYCNQFEECLGSQTKLKGDQQLW